MFVRKIISKKYVTKSIIFRFASAHFKSNHQCVDFPCVTKQDCIKLGRCNLQSREQERLEDKNDSSTNSTNININFNDNHKHNDININFDFRKDKENQNNTETNISPHVIEHDDVTESVGQTLSDTIVTVVETAGDVAFFVADTVGDVVDAISDFDD